ncbi:MAG: DUF1805 domain-containing protein [Pirellulales bacterium]
MSRMILRCLLIAGLCPLLSGGCGQEPLGGPSKNVVRAGARASDDEADEPQVAASSVELASDALPAAEDGIWKGLEPHEIQLDQKLLVVKGSRGVVGCPYLNIDSFEKFGEACAIIPAVDVRGMPDSKVTAVTTKAKELGIEVGMSGREALDKIR